MIFDIHNPPETWMGVTIYDKDDRKIGFVLRYDTESREAVIVETHPMEEIKKGIHKTISVIDPVTGKQKLKTVRLEGSYAICDGVKY